MPDYDEQCTILHIILVGKYIISYTMDRQYIQVITMR